MKLNYKDIELSSSQRKLLKTLKKRTLPQHKIPEKDLVFFKKFKLIKCVNSNEAFYHQVECIYKITDAGLAYLRFHLKDCMRTWYPHIISTFGLVIAILSLILSITVIC